MEAFRNLYVHFPYCETKCHYCDFFSLPESKFQSSERERVFNSIQNELKLYRLDELQTIFLGGGTPSLVPLDILSDFFTKLNISKDAEVTMEVNPSSVTKEKANRWKSIGVERISMGVQALNDDRLKWLSRVHDKKNAISALMQLFDADISRVSIDYIVGVPGQTVEMIRSELSEVFSKFPNLNHLSAYLLTLQNSNAKKSELPDEDTQVLHLQQVREVLSEFGLEQYEISNFSKPGYESRHNENYWKSGSYLGIGPSAHSFSNLESRRFKNWASLGKYVELVESEIVPVEWSEEIDLEKKRIEYLMLRLRHRNGFLISEYNSIFNSDFIKNRSSLIESLLKKDLIEINSDRIKLKGSGYFLSDSIIEKLI